MKGVKIADAAARLNVTTRKGSKMEKIETKKEALTEKEMYEEVMAHLETGSAMDKALIFLSMGVIAQIRANNKMEKEKNGKDYYPGIRQNR